MPPTIINVKYFPKVSLTFHFIDYSPQNQVTQSPNIYVLECVMCLSKPVNSK